MLTEIVELGPPDVDWSFNDGSPRLRCPRPTIVDPFPAYAHERVAVEETLRHVAEVAPIELAPRALYLLSLESVTRTNGWAEPDSDYVGENWVPVPGTIVLPGKRIPPHPAMTRYVTAHEYGHHVQYDLQRQRGEETHNDDGLLAEYARIRRVDVDAGKGYGGGRWHSNTGELFANDFRILVAGVEEEFWPHPGFTRPDKLKGVQRFWAGVGW